MFKNIKPDELLNSKEIVREPVNDLYKKISNDPSQKIILTGGRGTGKTITLRNMETENINSNNTIFYIDFSSINVLQQKQPKFINKQFLCHIYELTLCKYILNYIKKNYFSIYEIYFKDFDLLLYSITEKTNSCINNSFYESIKLNNYLIPTELSYKILNNFRNCLNVNSICLIIDRFDWLNNNEMSQYIVSSFFDMFDKSIITADDYSLQNKENRQNFIDKGYSFVDVDYGKDIDIAKNILQKRIEYYNAIVDPDHTPFSKENIADEIYEILINKTNGNITLMLDCLKNVIELWNCYKGNIDLEEQFNESIDNQIFINKNLRKIIKQPKLNLTK